MVAINNNAAEELADKIKENIDNFEDSINIVKLNIEGSESMVIDDLVKLTAVLVETVNGWSGKSI